MHRARANCTLVTRRQTALGDTALRTEEAPLPNKPWTFKHQENGGLFWFYLTISLILITHDFFFTLILISILFCCAWGLVFPLQAPPKCSLQWVASLLPLVEGLSHSAQRAPLSTEAKDASLGVRVGFSAFYSKVITIHSFIQSTAGVS